MKVLVTGASGYVGSRLIEKLLSGGDQVRVVTRDSSRLSGKPWAAAVEVVIGDIGEQESCRQALDGIDIAYYLVHSMGEGRGFRDREAEVAAQFAAQAEEAKVKRIVYLGGMSTARGEELSEHMASRHMVGEILRQGVTPVTELRAAIIIGSGSLPFEMLRHLVDVLPAMTTPKWTTTKCQPIAISDVVHYLTVSGRDTSTSNHLFDIGGPDILSYSEMMARYAKIAGLVKRPNLKVPILSPGLSSRWIGLVTPIPAQTARTIVESMRHEVVVLNPIGDYIGHSPMSIDEAMELALWKEREIPPTHSGRRNPVLLAETRSGDPHWAGRKILADTQSMRSHISASALRKELNQVGGEKGYYAYNFLWKVRGWIDRSLGGPGLDGPREGRALVKGEAFDFWEVSDVSKSQVLLRARMKMPGQAWLQWEVSGGTAGSTLTQKALFYPKGIAGRVYWYSMLPFHKIIFKAMCRNIVREAQKESVGK